MSARKFLLALCPVVLFLPLHAIADTYSPYPTVTLGYGRGYLVGLTATGVQVTNVPVACPSTTSASCFQTYDPNTESRTFSTSNPAFSYDDGSPCTSSSSPTSLEAVYGVFCNGSHEVFLGTTDTNNPHSNSVVLGINGPIFTSLDQIFGIDVDSLGDVSFNLIDVGLKPDSVVGFIDQTSRTSVTPEPSSLVLLGTGVISVLATRKRRRPSPTTANV